jgi:hypothetical protein
MSLLGVTLSTLNPPARTVSCYLSAVIQHLPIHIDYKAIISAHPERAAVEGSIVNR